MSLDLENQNIKDTFQRLVQVSGSNLVDGTGSVLLALKADNLEGNLSGSFVGNLGDGITVNSGSTKILSTGFLGQTSASQGTGPAGFVIYSGSNTTTLGGDTLSGTGFKFVSANDNSHIIFTDQNDGDLSIKTDKFTLENNGDITASNALFSGTAIARNFILSSDTVVGPDSVGGSTVNFGQYMSGSNPLNEADYALYLDGTQTDSNGTGSIINSIEFKLSQQINLTDIIVANENTLVNDKINITIRNRADSRNYLGFSVKQSAGQLFTQEMSPGNVYTFEISFDNLGSKTITALTATDLTVPFTASSYGFQLLGDINQTGNINQTGTITTSGNIFTNTRISAGNSRPNSPSKTLHISSSINGDGIRIQGPNNPLIQASNDTGVIYSIGAITSADTQLLGSVAGDTTFRYSNNDNPNGRLLFGSGSNTTPTLVLNGDNVGIGTTSPSAKLDVSGSSKFTDDLQLTGSLFINDGYQNLCIGEKAGESIVRNSNRKNTFIGIEAGSNSTSGQFNTAIGYQALSGSTSGINNVAIGEGAMQSSTIASTNVAIGVEAMEQSKTSIYNVAIGFQALQSVDNTGGGTSVINGSVGIGYRAGGVNQAKGCVFIGQEAFPSQSGDINSIVIGSGSVGVGSNSVVLGNNSITKTVLKGKIGIGINSPETALHISSSATVSAVLTLDPQHPLPTNSPTGSFAVSSSSPPKPYFYNGTTWNALY